MRRGVVRAIGSKVLRAMRFLRNYLAFLLDYRRFRSAAGPAPRFGIHWKDRYPCLDDKTSSHGFDAHYIYHPAWAARVIRSISPPEHVDLSSKLDFSCMLSAFVPTRLYDYRPANIRLDGLKTGAADLTALPFGNDSVPSLSCMHVVEHVGLGRYGDAIDPEGDRKACAEISRVVAKGGALIFVVPVGKSRIEYNAHRIYSYRQVLELFPDFELVEFSLVPDDGVEKGLIRNADPALVGNQSYGCGCFWFRKPKS